MCGVGSADQPCVPGLAGLHRLHRRHHPRRSQAVDLHQPPLHAQHSGPGKHVRGQSGSEKCFVIKTLNIITVSSLKTDDSSSLVNVGNKAGFRP